MEAKKVILHNEENKHNKRWLMVVNSIEGDTHHRDFTYHRYKINLWIDVFLFKVFWGSFGPDLFIQTYDMKNLKRYETGKITKELIDSGYFKEIKHRPLKTRF
jgi:hypothetical protein